MAWESTAQDLEGARGQRVSIRREGVVVCWRDVLEGWRNDGSFQAFFIQLLADAPLEAFRFETPPVTRATLQEPFEFVLLEAPGLDRTPDARAFADQFDSRPVAETVITFPNL